MSDADDVKTANDAFYAAFTRGDMPAMDALWSSQATVTCIHPGWDVLIGRGAVMASWAAILANSGRPRIKASEPHVVVGGGMAVVVCHEHVHGARLVGTNVFVLEDGAWRMIHHQAGPAPDAEPTSDGTDTVH
ncbi:MAG: DUF4440 domain-containing protein [Alphaproteobacteria bacterium]|nr:DUF4440 domain-containing protein [Alphaproteobacteria bacterium]